VIRRPPGCFHPLFFFSFDFKEDPPPLSVSLPMTRVKPSRESTSRGLESLVPKRCPFPPPPPLLSFLAGHLLRVFPSAQRKKSSLPPTRPSDYRLVVPPLEGFLFCISRRFLMRRSLTLRLRKERLSPPRFFPRIAVSWFTYPPADLSPPQVRSLT